MIDFHRLRRMFPLKENFSLVTGKVSSAPLSTVELCVHPPFADCAGAAGAPVDCEKFVEEYFTVDDSFLRVAFCAGAQAKGKSSSFR